MNYLRPTSHTDPVVIVGSGLAGLSLALRLAGTRDVVVVTKGVIDAGSTQYAQGGLAAAIAPADSVADHVEDTLAAGAGLCDVEAVEMICEAGPRVVRELIALGVAFDRDPDGTLALAREGAHRLPRVVHAGGDATGAHIARALVAAVRQNPRIAVEEHTLVTEVIVAEGQAAGVRTRDADGGSRTVRARAVVLATGGLGHVFARTTNPVVATADGPALAHRAGAAVADLELVQFHPTALALGDSPLALVSEAVRGHGAYLRDVRGRRFMRELHPMAELGPRDVVARAIFARAAVDDADVTLDLRHLDAADVRRSFPTVTAACAAHGLDLATDLIPVTPAVHYAMGGVLTDTLGRATLPGLYAIGECATSGVHGANRLASNSLLEAAAMGERVAATIDAGDDWPEGPVGPATAPKPAERAWRPIVQGAMWDGAGVVREATGLARAAEVASAPPAGDDHETANIAEVATLLARAAALRAESRGGHFRSDHPEPDSRFLVRFAFAAGVPHEIPVRIPSLATVEER